MDGGDPRRALAALAARDGPRMPRTMNGGLFWDDLSGKGLFFAITPPGAAAPAPVWTALNASLPRAPVIDVHLNESGNRIYADLDGYGVFAATAPHRFATRLRRCSWIATARPWCSTPTAACCWTP